MPTDYHSSIRSAGKFGYDVRVTHAGKTSVYIAPTKKIAREIASGKTHPKKYHVTTI